MTNIELQVLTLFKTALAKYNSEDIWEQRRVELVGKILQGILSNPSVQFMPNRDGNIVATEDGSNPFVEAAIIMADDAIKQLKQ